ncbi:unnamed protein product [Oppiella nova]|uniref:Succinate dehydrogenase cytochrome b560 subunit, mitochondrial n=1 Tax=Oppiella nova TaxID=334625 RepID=A0A7R9QU46_9ACAR|nr:unnamed protein product [Oppiella nova]CAG2174467.1 unnamed protein product [Oppiella nova]
MLTQAVLRRVLASTPRMAAIRMSSTSSATTPSEDYFAKNSRLNRPLSPYTHYKPQITTVLSISHRMTGLALSVLLYGGGISALASSQTNFAQVLQSIQTTVPHSLLFTVKVLAGTSLVYHILNGIRHLSWDYGFGFSLKELYTTGYIVVALSLLSALVIAIYAN